MGGKLLLRTNTTDRDHPFIKAAGGVPQRSTLGPLFFII